ncbi:MAG: cache domain-containing protein, partial [Chromatiales bacterium]
MFRLLPSLRGAIARSLRYKLLLLTLVPLLLFVPAILALAVSWSGEFSREQLLRAVHTDLRVARDGFLRTQQDYLETLSQLAGSYSFLSSLDAQDGARIIDQLEVLEVIHGFDFIDVTDLHGRRLYGTAERAAARPVEPSMLEDAVHSGRGSVGIQVMTLDEVTRLDPALTDRVRLALVDTPQARPTDRTVETRAMVVRAVQPVRDAQGSLVAVIDAGVVLNRNYAFVDRIRDLVYGPGSLPEGGWGAVSILLGDTQITTNVPVGGSGGERALGTRLSADVAERVLG